VSSPTDHPRTPQSAPDRSGPPFRADHVGSLLRPDRLLAARDDRAAGRIDDAGLRAVEDEAIADAVRMQRDIGLRTATDGEFRRATWHMDFIYAIAGISRVDGEGRVVHFKNADGSIDWAPAGLHVDGPLSIDEPIFGDHFRYLRGVASADQTPKLTIPSPSMVHYRGGAAAIDPAVYPDEDAFWAALSAAYASQIRGVAALGCTYLQLDDTSLAYLNDPSQRAEIAAQGRDAEHLHERYIRQVNAALAGRTDSPSRRTCAAGTSAPPGWPRAATTSWPRRCSARWTSTGSSSSTTTPAPVGSSRCGTCRRASASSWAW
jgi:5-methyltetrahydropteroyltriglutamate--homocysteine methyltransferase